MYDALTFQIDHIIARKHHGTDEFGNLALACFACNNHKGPNIAGVDPETDKIIRLFNPRQDSWQDHFEWHEAVLIGCTPVGRVTIDVLAINTTLSRPVAKDADSWRSVSDSLH